MFEFRTGLPGSGKSLSLVRDIYWKLVYTNRKVGTTLVELDVGKLTAYIAKKHPHDNFRINERLFFIPKSDTATFYRYRGDVTFDKPPPMPKTASQEEKDKICEDYFRQYEAREGVDYFLTEAHRHFKADTWADMSDVVMFYASQHRHLDDNVCVETQVPKMVVVQFRDLAEICCELQNHYRQRFGYFQKIGRFVAVYYYGVPKPGTKGEVSHKTTFTLDKVGLASCYATRGAITGIGGATPETDVVKKGLPFWAIPVGGTVFLAVVCCAIWFSGDLFGWAFKSVIGRFFKPAQKAVQEKVVTGTGIEPRATNTLVPPVSVPPGEHGVTLRSVTIKGQRAIFVLSDGRVWSSRNKLLIGCEYDPETGVLTLKDGRSYTLERKREEPAKREIFQPNVKKELKNANPQETAPHGTPPETTP